MWIIYTRIYKLNLKCNDTTDVNDISLFLNGKNKLSAKFILY